MLLMGKADTNPVAVPQTKNERSTLLVVQRPVPVRKREKVRVGARKLKNKEKRNEINNGTITTNYTRRTRSSTI
jgi:hypothetical protein